MSKLEFKDVTILYNEATANKKLCKRKRRQMMLWSFVTAILLFILWFVELPFMDYFAETASIVIGAIFMVCFMVGSIFLATKVLYRNTIKAFSFMEWLFQMKEVQAGWYNNKILLRVQHYNGIDDYSLQGFVDGIENELTITDKSDKGKPIHIVIDITNNETTEITIENKLQE